MDFETKISLLFLFRLVVCLWWHLKYNFFILCGSFGSSSQIVAELICSTLFSRVWEGERERLKYDFMVCRVGLLSGLDCFLMLSAWGEDRLSLPCVFWRGDIKVFKGNIFGTNCNVNWLFSKIMNSNLFRFERRLPKRPRENFSRLQNAKIHKLQEAKDATCSRVCLIKTSYLFFRSFSWGIIAWQLHFAT